MGMRTVNDFRGSETVLVDQMIGTAYDTVRHVARNIEYVKHVSHNLPELYRLSESAEQIDGLFEKLEEVDSLFLNLDQVISLSDNIDSVTTVEYNLPEIRVLNSNTAQIFADADYVREFSERFGSVDLAIETSQNVLAQTQDAYNSTVAISDVATTEANRAEVFGNIAQAAELSAQLSAEAALLAATSSPRNYDTLALANAAIADIPANGGVNILNDGANNGFYVKEGSALVRKSTATLLTISETANRVSRAVDVLPPSQEYAHTFQDSAGFFEAYMRADSAWRNVKGRQDILGLNIVQDTNNWLAITDNLGFVLGMFSSTGVDLPGISGGTTEELQPTSIIPHFTDTLCGISGKSLNIFLSGILENREDIPRTVMSVFGNGGVTATSDQQITVKTDEMGTTGELVVHPRIWNGGERAVRSLRIRNAPDPAIAPTQKNILLIGDSIGNRQGAFLLNQYLRESGYIPNFIGTMRGSASPTSAGATDGPLGECREGWETGDYTNRVTNRSFPIAPGQEAAYLAMSKNDQRDRNPFIRAATPDDPFDIVRNGYVLDFNFYRSRFNLAVPDVIIYALGTNDIRDLSSAVVGDEVYQNDLLLLSRLRAAWPNARIIRTLPGTARDITRDPLWGASYIPVIKGIMRAQNQLADPRMVLAPVWAMVSQDGGYSLQTGSTDPITGTVVTTPNDAIHPIDGNRAAIYRALSGYVACAMSEQF